MCFSSLGNHSNLPNKCFSSYFFSKCAFFLVCVYVTLIYMNNIVLYLIILTFLRYHYGSKPLSYAACG